MLARVNGFLTRSPFFFKKRWVSDFRGVIQHGFEGITVEEEGIDLSNQIFKTHQDEKLKQIVLNFSSSSMCHSFGYGSGVFRQAGYLGSTPQIDFIHIVEDPKSFHESTSSRFPSHYSGLLRWGGTSAVCWTQNLGAGVYFNPYVPMSDHTGQESMIKYGVTSKSNALKDVCEWSSLYIAGRLQKPVKHIYGSNLLKAVNQFNLDSAFNLALLLHSTGKHSKSLMPKDIFEMIALLSYMGDPRMLIGGENPNKVKNIVNKQLDDFRKLYSKSFERAIQKSLIKSTGDDVYEVILDSAKRVSIISELPLQFRTKLIKQFQRRHKLSQLEGLLGAENVIESLSMSRGLNRKLLMAVQSTIAFPAFVQTAKGVFTAGITKSVKYAWEKRLKSLKRA